MALVKAVEVEEAVDACPTTYYTYFVKVGGLCFNEDPVPTVACLQQQCVAECYAIKCPNCVRWVVTDGWCCLVLNGRWYWMVRLVWDKKHCY